MFIVFERGKKTGVREKDERKLVDKQTKHRSGTVCDTGPGKRGQEIWPKAEIDNEMDVLNGAVRETKTRPVISCQREYNILMKKTTLQVNK